jgi:hypothetical protein
MLNKVLLITFILAAYSIQLNAADEMVMVVVENNNEKKLAKNIDPFLASTINGLNTIQKTVDNTGLINCRCNHEGGVYFSTVLGNGLSDSNESMNWRAFEIRLGKSYDDNKRFDFIHINEGHMNNNHRDGFAIEAVYDLPLTNNLKLEAGIGPYFSMNTTIVDNKESDDKHLGLLTTVAALYALDGISAGLHLRASYNHVVMPGTISMIQ